MDACLVPVPCTKAGQKEQETHTHTHKDTHTRDALLCCDSWMPVCLGSYYCLSSHPLPSSPSLSLPLPSNKKQRNQQTPPILSKSLRYRRHSHVYRASHPVVALLHLDDFALLYPLYASDSKYMRYLSVCAHRVVCESVALPHTHTQQRDHHTLTTCAMASFPGLPWAFLSFSIIACTAHTAPGHQGINTQERASPSDT